MNPKWDATDIKALSQKLSAELLRKMQDAIWRENQPKPGIRQWLLNGFDEPIQVTEETLVNIRDWLR